MDPTGKIIDISAAEFQITYRQFIAASEPPVWSTALPDTISLDVNNPYSLVLADYVSDANTAFSDLKFAVESRSEVSYSWQGDTLTFATSAVSASEGMVYLTATNGLAVSSTDSIWVAIREPLAVDDPAAVPQRYGLSDNYPNPFNPSTTIHFELPEAAHVSLTVYDVEGRAVKTLVNAYRAAGSYTLTWNGLDDAGNTLSTGIYLGRLQAGTGPSGAVRYSKTIRMLYLK